MALGRSGFLQALRQSHLQLSHKTSFIPSIFLSLILSLSFHVGPITIPFQIYHLYLFLNTVFK